MSHDRISRLITERYRAHSRECRRIWRLKGDGPALHAVATSENEAGIRLYGRSRTLAKRHFKWTHDGGDGTIPELLGAMNSGKPLDVQLSNVAMTLALRAAIAADMGAGATSLPADRILIDRFAASRLASRDGEILAEIAKAARAADADEAMPNSQLTMTSAGRMQFVVQPCEVDIPADMVRQPQVRLTAIELSDTTTYIHSRLQIAGGILPETLAIAATGRPLREVMDTGEPLLADRTIETVTRAGDALIIHLVEDMVEIRELDQGR